MGLPKIDPPRPVSGPDLLDVCELGAGGMGSVSLARLRGAAGFERLVVVKRLHPHLAKDDVILHRFLTEARIASRIHHANVVGIQQVGEDADGYYLVLDYVDGGSLHELIKSCEEGVRLSPRVAGRIVIDALAGIEAVHSARDVDGRMLGVLHRDVSPQNLLVGRDGVTRVTDFGVSKGLDDKSMTVPGTYVGKIRYVAPEYLLQESVDRTVDVYAMGVTAWCAFSGGAPWLGLGEGKMAIEIVKAGVPPLPDDVASPAVREVIAKACALKASDRFASAAAFAEALIEALPSSGGIATPSEVAERVEQLLAEPIRVRRESLASCPDITSDVHELDPMSRRFASSSASPEEVITPPELLAPPAWPALVTADTRPFALLIPKRPRGHWGVALATLFATSIVAALFAAVRLSHAESRAGTLVAARFAEAVPAAEHRTTRDAREDAAPSLAASSQSPSSARHAASSSPRSRGPDDISPVNPYR